MIYLSLLLLLRMCLESDPVKTVVITGSARGFGYAMLEKFYRKDYNVVIWDC